MTDSAAARSFGSATGSGPMVGQDYVLSLSCPAQRGVIFTMAKFIVEHGGDISETRVFDDKVNQRFFMRVRFSIDVGCELESLRAQFAPTASALGMSWRLMDPVTRQRVLIMVSKYGHCLNDLLFRAGTGSLDIDVPAVVSNHPDLRSMADYYDVPFYHIPVDKDDKATAEAQLLELVDQLDIDLVVLARYMQILSTPACGKLAGRAINIHHSMLPSFKGARPYYQAYDRGVKLVGATAHYVTADLDEGPIIDQEVARVEHWMTAEDVTTAGRDNECLALSRAVRWHTQHRVLLDGHRTIVFR